MHHSDGRELVINAIGVEWSIPSSRPSFVSVQLSSTDILVCAVVVVVAVVIVVSRQQVLG